MRIVARSTLKKFYSNPKYKDSEKQLEAWYYEAKHANWKSPIDVKDRYPEASVIGDNRIVFDICHNKYRLIVKFNYEYGIGYIRFIDTHKVYDQIDAETI